MWRLLFVTVWILLPEAPAAAGQTCRETAPNVVELRDAATAAVNLVSRLDETGAGLAVIARVGGDISRHGLKYTHAGFAWRDHPCGRWLVVHALNPCGTGRSVLLNQGLMRFFLDDPLVRDTLVLIPRVPLQRAVADLLASRRAALLHQPRYSMLAYPGGDLRYQNSNQWIAEVLTLAMARLEGRDPGRRAAVAREARARGLRGSPIRLSLLERLVAKVGRANVRFDDHPAEPRCRRRRGAAPFASLPGPGWPVGPDPGPRARRPDSAAAGAPLHHRRRPRPGGIQSLARGR